MLKNQKIYQNEIVILTYFEGCQYADTNAAINIRNRLSSDNQVVPLASSSTTSSFLPDRGGVTPPVVTSKT